MIFEGTTWTCLSFHSQTRESSFSLVPNEWEERVICEFEMDFQKSFCSRSDQTPHSLCPPPCNVTVIGCNFCLWKHESRSENWCGKWHFLVWNRARIWRTSHHRTVHPHQEFPRVPPGISQSWLIIVIYILISFSFLFWVVRHFRLSLLNNFYCEIFPLYNIVIRIINSVTSVNLKTAGMAGQNIVINKTLTERTLRRRCTKLMWLFFVSGTCECRNVVNQGLVEKGEKGDVEP